MPLAATDRAAWLEARRGYLGASDVGGLLLDRDGHPIHPYRTPHDVWLDKKGLSEFEESERTIMGTALEPLVAWRFRSIPEQSGLRLRHAETTWAPQGESWHACNPDRLIAQKVSQIPGTSLIQPDRKGLSAIFQIKTAGYFGAQDFGAAGTDEVPDWYVAQVQWELYCTGRDLAVLGLLHDTHLYRQFLIYRDEELIGTLRRVVDDFWRRYVLADVEPPLTGHKADGEYVKAHYAPKEDRLIVASPDWDEVVEKYARNRANLKRLEHIVDAQENQIKNYMGEATRLATSSGEITWKPDKNGRRSFKADLGDPTQERKAS